MSRLRVIVSDNPEEYDFRILIEAFEALILDLERSTSLHRLDGSIAEAIACLERAKALACRGATLARQLALHGR